MGKAACSKHIFSEEKKSDIEELLKALLILKNYLKK